MEAQAFAGAAWRLGPKSRHSPQQRPHTAGALLLFLLVHIASRPKAGKTARFCVDYITIADELATLRNAIKAEYTLQTEKRQCVKLGVEGVGSGKGQNSTLRRVLHRFRHLYSPVSRI